MPLDVVTARPTELDRYAALARTTGIIGIAFLVLMFGPIIALASADEPALEATAAEAAKYFGNLEATWAQRTMAASTLGMIGSLWFFVAFGFLPGRCQVRLDGGILGRWLRALLAVDHRGLYPTDRSAGPVEQRRTLRSAAHALDRPGVHEADVCAGSRRYPWPMARPTPAQRHQLIGEEGEQQFRVDPAARTLVA